jgi:hypothetical protein
MSILTHDALISSPPFPVPPILRTPRPQDVRDAARAFTAAHEAAEEAFGGLTAEQEAGYAALPPEVEFLLDEAQRRSETLLKVAGLHDVVTSILGLRMTDDEIDDALNAASGYPQRPKVPNAVPTSGDWRNHVAGVDWTRGGPA